MAKKTAAATEEVQDVFISIPAPEVRRMKITLEGTAPLITNNKYGINEYLHRRYSQPGGDAVLKPELTDDEKYIGAFYVLPSSKYEPPHPKGKYGIPTNAIRKAAIAGAGLTGNMTPNKIGAIIRSFQIREDENGLSQIHFGKLERDIRGVVIGNHHKTSELRHRPRFEDWYINLDISYNPRMIQPATIANLLMYAGYYIGIGEMRAEKKQGSCGSFTASMG